MKEKQAKGESVVVVAIVAVVRRRGEERKSICRILRVISSPSPKQKLSNNYRQITYVLRKAWRMPLIHSLLLTSVCHDHCALMLALAL